MQFVQAQFPDENPLCVTYFDEAHELGSRFWILLRLLRAQSFSTRMWYVFMETKPSISYHDPTPPRRNSESLSCVNSSTADVLSVSSLKLRMELARLVPPYIALGFDQHAIARHQTASDFCMGTFETIQHLAQYGRPLYVSFLVPPVPTFILISDGPHKYL